MALIPNLQTNYDYGIRLGAVKNKLTNLVEDITGWQFWLTIKENLTDTDANAKIQQIGVIEGDPKLGYFYFLIPYTKITDSLVGTYYFDIKVRTLAGNYFEIKTENNNRISIEYGVTRALS